VGLGKSSIYEGVKAGTFPSPVKLSRRAVCWSSVSVDAWISERIAGKAIGGKIKNAILQQVRAFLETHGDSRFAMWHRAADDHAPKTLQRAGVRRLSNEAGAGAGRFEYFVLNEIFKTEVCRGYDVQVVCAVLLEHGSLSIKELGRYSIKTTLPGIGDARCYLITPAIFGPFSEAAENSV